MKKSRNFASKITHFLNETALILSMVAIGLLAVGIIGGLIWVFSGLYSRYF